MVWNVLVEDFNKHTIELRNVFELSVRFNRELEALRQKECVSYEDFSADLRHATMRAFWSKCEYEVLVCPWPYHPDQNAERKIDVYDQLNLNWDAFVSYTIGNLWGDENEEEKE